MVEKSFEPNLPEVLAVLSWQRSFRTRSNARCGSDNSDKSISEIEYNLARKNVSIEENFAAEQEEVFVLKEEMLQLQMEINLLQTKWEYTCQRYFRRRFEFETTAAYY